MIDDANNQKKAIGNICRTIHRDKYQVRPRFLRRNLREILDSHEKLLRGDMIANEKRNWGWDFPTTDMLREFMSGDKPILQVESLRIRHPESSPCTKRKSREQLSNGDDLDWLPNPENDAIWPCTVGVSVWHVQSSKRQIHVAHLPAKILQGFGNGHYPDYEIKLDKPFFIEISKLFVVTESGTNGSRTWKKTATAQYQLDVTIQCQDSDDSADFLSRLEGKGVSAYEHASSSESVLRATWDDLPRCPPDDHLLTLKRPKGHSSLELKYKLEVAMGWITRREYKLKTYNREFHSKQQNERQLPTPSASDDMENGAKRYNIIWAYRHSSATNTFLVKSLTCALCRDDRDYTYFERLMLHCKTHHDHFKFDAEYDLDKPDSTLFRATVTMSIAPQPLEKQIDENEDGEINWVAPDRPFNLRAHLRGEDDWTGQGRSKSKRGPGRQIRDKRAVSASHIQPSRKHAAPEEVEDLPEHMPKKHCVPNVPGVNFYRTTSKQLIKPGEYLAESDDEVDESWLVQTQNRALEDLGITGVAKEFTSAFNEHLAREQSNSSVLVRDALVRFARLYKHELKNLEWQQLFRAKLNQLRGVGIVGDEIVEYCVRLMQKARDDEISPSEAGATLAGQDERTLNLPGPRSGINGHLPRNASPEHGHSASPRNGFIRQNEGPTSAGGKGVLRETRHPNEGTLPGAAHPRNGEKMTPNGGLGYSSHDKTTNRRQQSTIPAQSHRNRCTCGVPATETRATIACANPRCMRKDFHLACVGLEKRVLGWRCADCSE